MKHRGNECQDANGKGGWSMGYLDEAFRDSREEIEQRHSQT